MENFSSSLPLISVVVLNYNGKNFLNDCLDSVLKSDYSNFELILVDNASLDSSLKSAEEKFGRDSRFRIVINDKNLLYAGGNNQGIKAAKGEYLIILNNDTVADRLWLKEIAFGMVDNKIGAAQPKILLYSDPKRLDYAGADIDKYGYAKGRGYGEVDTGQYDKTTEIFYAGGAAMVLRREAIKDVGFFDPKFTAHWEDIDLSWRIRLAGYKVVLIPKAVVYHKGSQSMSQFLSKHTVAWYVRKNRIAGLIKNYNIFNLIKVMPSLLFIYFILFLKEIVFDKNIKLAMSSISAIAWNIKELPYILKQRRLVQTKIRLVPDANVVKFMLKKCMALDHLRRSYATK